MSETTMNGETDRATATEAVTIPASAIPPAVMPAMAYIRPKPAAAPAYNRRTAWLELPDHYRGWYVYIWVNHPSKLSEDAESFDIARRIATLGIIFLDHNDWPDPTQPGATLPATTDPEFWNRVPDEVFSIMVALLRAEKDRIPNSIRQTSQR